MSLADEDRVESSPINHPSLVSDNGKGVSHVMHSQSMSESSSCKNCVRCHSTNQQTDSSPDHRSHSSSSFSEADLAEFNDRVVISDTPASKNDVIRRKMSKFRESSVDDDLTYHLKHRRRTRSLYGVSPSCRFGPKASIMKNQANLLTIQDPGSQRLTWYKPPLSVLIIKKIYDDSIIEPFKDMITWLILEKNMVVFIEKNVLEEPMLKNDDDFTKLRNKLRTFKEGEDDLTDKVDMIICLGGDGTLLYASSLFQQSVPPIMAFHLGSLGFLTPFQFYNFRDQVAQVMEGNAALILRSRLKCAVLKKDHECSQCTTAIKHVESRQHILVLNEIVIDRGPSPYLCHVDLYIEGRYITSVQGDGLIVSTPTGSTAYAGAAGASMIHPSVPAILITPICAHSLSFRPIVVPAGVEVKVMISPNARNSAWVSFDGRNRQELMEGDNLRISTSIYPVPSLCSQDQIGDWFASLGECLHWNVRRHQKAFVQTPSRSSLGSSDSSDTNGSGYN